MEAWLPFPAQTTLSTRNTIFPQVVKIQETRSLFQDRLSSGQPVGYAETTSSVCCRREIQ